MVVLLALTGVTTLVWTALDWPPPGMILRYGLSYGCEPTGETKLVGGVEFVEIGPGCYRMGSTYLAGGDWFGRICAAVGLPWGDQPEPSREMPVHWVEFRRGFWIARTEVTNEQYEAFDPRHERSEFSPGDQTAVVDVSWWEAKEYCAWLAEKSGLLVRLPSEAEWECACRAGSNREFSCGDDENLLPSYAWFSANSDDRVHEVATRRPSAWGLHDLHGNVWEWCEDTFQRSYEDAPVDGTAWTEGDEESEVGTRVYRGGSSYYPAEYCRSAGRNWDYPSYRVRSLGFRPAFSLPGD